jgi:polysaccharide chain length determinant protein (PEP-CTERM system associated)
MEPGDFLEVLRRRKWLIVFSFLVIIFAALVYCVVVPDLYESGAKILIIPPAVAEGMVRTTVNLSAGERLMAIRSDVLGRPRLMGVIQSIGVSKLGFQGMSESDMVEKMRSRINIEVDRSKNRERDVNTFILSVLHEDPKVAQEVASNLSSLFIGENIKLRETVTQETTMFLDTQLEETRKRLEQQEEKIKQYKIQFGGELPQQEHSNLNRLERLSDRIKSNDDAIARLQDRKVLLETQIATYVRGRAVAGEGSEEAMVPTGLLTELAVRRKKLEEATRKYTERHPAVVQARWEVEQAEAKIAEAKAAGASSAGAGSAGQDVEVEEVQRLRKQIASIDMEIGALKRENANKSAQIDEIQRKVERLPQREQEMVSLTRDYENLRKSYDDLLDKKLKANISRNLEENQKGERFQVVEPANLPTRPSEPDRVKVLLLALVGSFMVGIGGAIGLEIIDPTLKGSKEFRSFFEMPILASLPVIQDDEYKRKIAVRAKSIKAGLISIAGAYAVFLVVYASKIKTIIQSIATNIGG